MTDRPKRPTNLDIRQLRYFIAVAEEGSLRRAAERLHISQPPLGRQIQQIEAEVRAKLFTRTRSGVEITPFGTELLHHAYRIVQNLELAASQIAEVAEGLIGNIGIRFADEFLHSDLATVITGFKALYPDIGVRTDTGDSTQILHDLNAGKIDVGFSLFPLPATATNVRARLLAPLKLVVAVPSDHRLADRETIHLKEVGDETFICGNVTALMPFYIHVLSLFRQAGIAPRFMTDMTPQEFKLDLVAAGLGIAFTVWQPNRPPHPRIRFLRLLDHGAELENGVIWRDVAMERKSVALFLHHVDRWTAAESVQDQDRAPATGASGFAARPLA